jgi:allantoinase
MGEGLDLLVRGGTLVLPQGDLEGPYGGLVHGDLGVAGGRIAIIAPEIDEPAAEVVEAEGAIVFPGILDSHVHFNEPGRTDWEGLASGSAALAAGGGTAFFDMPLNSLPPVLDGESFARKRECAERHACLDFGLWGGLVPGNLDRLTELADAGAVGFKAFLADSGVPEFEAVTDTATLRQGMKRAAALGLPVAVHAEDDATVRASTAEQRRRGGCDPAAWLASRPVAAELLAIDRATELAGETGCALHVVHVSSPEGLERIAQARRRGVDVTAETCPHYLLLAEGDVARLGAVAKCAPPLRDEERRHELWRRLRAGEVDTLGSDHSPAPPAMKTAADFFAVWGGISGCQHGFPLLLSAALAQEPPEVGLPRFAALLAANVADRFRLAGRKGRLAVGLDADFSLLRIADRGEGEPARNADLLYRHRQGPYDGRDCRVRVLRTLVRGWTVHEHAATTTEKPRGVLLRPES